MIQTMRLLIKFTNDGLFPFPKQAFMARPFVLKKHQ